MLSHPSVAAIGETGESREGSGREPPSGQQCQQRRNRVAARAPFAAGGDQVPGAHARGQLEIGEQLVSLRPLQGDWMQPRGAIPAEQDGEQPLAKAAISVVENRPVTRRHASL
ncbi:MAG: hypothetical protein WA687_11540 [Solirubrobacterales bacterium]